MLQQVRVTRNGNNVFVDGAAGRTGTVHMTEAERVVGLHLDAAKRFRLLPAASGRRGVAATVYDDETGVEVVIAESSSSRLNLSVEDQLRLGHTSSDDANHALRKEGRIYREGATTVVEIMGKAYLLKEPGVTCVNPEAPEADRIYRKIFTKKKIYLPDELEAAISECLPNRYRMVLAMNGYSSIKPAQCAAWGVKVGAYEKACSVLLDYTVNKARSRFRDMALCCVHGASDMGVDKAVMDYCRKERIQQMGFNCPQYMFYVLDDDIPVYVAATVEEYSRAFVKTADVLIAANGRLQAFRMDIMAVFEYDKVVIPVNVLKLISTTGGPPARNADGTIEDAVAHFLQRVYFVGQHVFESGLNRDAWANALTELDQILTHIMRHILPPEVGLEVNDR